MTQPVERLLLTPLVHSSNQVIGKYAGKLYEKDKNKENKASWNR